MYIEIYEGAYFLRIFSNSVNNNCSYYVVAYVAFFITRIN